jgi:hypothetical protein
VAPVKIVVARPAGLKARLPADNRNSHGIVHFHRRAITFSPASRQTQLLSMVK